MRLQSLAAAPVAAALIVLAGCGEDALTRAEYVKQADAICADYSAQQKKLGEPKSVKDIERLAEKTKPLVEEQLKELRELAAPEELADDANAAYELIERQLPKIDELGEAAKANDVPKIQSIATEAGKLSDQADDKAKALGLKVCGEDS